MPQIILDIINLAIILIAILFLFDVLRKTKKELKRAYLTRLFSYIFLIIGIIIDILNVNRSAALSIAFDITLFLFLITGILSFYELDKCLGKATCVAKKKKRLKKTR